MKKAAHTRRLKVSRKVRPKLDKDDPFRYAYTEFSEITLSGVWLQKLGFNPGDLIKVTCAPETIVITVDRGQMEWLKFQGKAETAIRMSVKPYLMGLTRQVIANSDQV